MSMLRNMLGAFTVWESKARLEKRRTRQQWGNYTSWSNNNAHTISLSIKENLSNGSIYSLYSGNVSIHGSVYTNNGPKNIHILSKIWKIGKKWKHILDSEGYSKKREQNQKQGTKTLNRRYDHSHRFWLKVSFFIKKTLPTWPWQCLQFFWNVGKGRLFECQKMHFLLSFVEAIR